MKNTMGQFLTTLRKAKGYSQQEVADLLFVSNKTISSWERDATSPDLTMLVLVADLYEVTCDELIRGVKNTNMNDDKNKIMKESNIKRILQNSFDRFKRSVNICYIILFSALAILLFGIISLWINEILGIVLIIIAIISYIVCAFLFANFLNIANNVSNIEYESEELYKYSNKINLLKRKFYTLLYFPIILIFLLFIGFLFIRIMNEVFHFNLSTIRVILILIFLLTASILVIHVIRDKRVKK